CRRGSVRGRGPATRSPSRLRSFLRVRCSPHLRRSRSLRVLSLSFLHTFVALLFCVCRPFLAASERRLSRAGEFADVELLESVDRVVDLLLVAGDLHGDG